MSTDTNESQALVLRQSIWESLNELYPDVDENRQALLDHVMDSVERLAVEAATSRTVAYAAGQTAAEMRVQRDQALLAVKSLEHAIETMDMDNPHVARLVQFIMIAADELAQSGSEE
jgi:hypothetical protein